MRTNKIHITLLFCLLINILFSQVFSAFFHNHNHSEKVASVETKNFYGEEILTSKTDECKICSLDIFHELFYTEPVPFNFLSTHDCNYQEIKSELITENSFKSKDRAPPFISSYSI